MKSLSLKDIMKEYKSRYQYTNQELAEQFQVSTNTVNRWLRGEIQTIHGETADRISKILGYDVLSVLHGNIVDLKKPIIGMDRAGYQLFIVQNHLGDAIVSFDEYNEGDYFIKVKGNDMRDAGIIDGSLVYIKKTNQVKSDEIALVIINDIAYLRYFKKIDDYIELTAANPEVDEMHFTTKEARKQNVSVIGKVLFSKNVY